MDFLSVVPRFPSSLPPEIVLVELNQELKDLFISLQRQFVNLDKEVRPHQEEQISTIYRDIQVLVQLHTSIRIYLTSFNETSFLGDISKAQERQKNSSQEILKTFSTEAGHVIHSMGGWIDILMETTNQDLKQQALLQINQLLQVLIEIHGKLSQYFQT